MKTILFALIAASVIFALSPIGESFAQTDPPAPYVVTDGAKFVGPNTITIEFSEPVIAGLDSFEPFTVSGTSVNPIAGADQSRTVEGISGIGTDTLTLNISGDPLPSDATTTITINNTLMSFAAHRTPYDATTDPIPVADGQTPTIMSAKIVDGAVVRIEFSESIEMNQDTFVDFRLTEGMGITDELSLSIIDFNYGTDPPSKSPMLGDRGTNIAIVAFSYENVPSDAIGTIDIKPFTASDGIVYGADLGGNELEPVDDYPLEAGQIPTVESAAITGPNTIMITFSEDVEVLTENFTDFRLTGGTGVTVGESRTVSLLSYNSTNYTATLDVSRDALPTDAVGTIDIRPTTYINAQGVEVPNALIDQAGNPAAPLNDYPVVDKQGPKILTIPLLSGANGNTRSDLIGPNTITITFTEPVTAELSDFHLILRFDGPSTERRSLIGLSGSGTDTITLTFGGAPALLDTNRPVFGGTLTVADLGVDSSIIRTPTNTITDLEGNKFVPAGNRGSATTVLMSQPLDIVSAKITEPQTIVVEFSRSVSLTPGSTLADTFSFTVRGESVPRTLTGDLETSTLILAVGGNAIPPNAVGLLDIKDTLIATENFNHLTAVTIDPVNDYPVVAGQIPTVEEAKIIPPAPDTDSSRLSVTFSEPVEDVNLLHFTDFRLTGGTDVTVGESRTFVDGSFTPTDNNTYTMLITGDRLPADATATVDIRPHVVDGDPVPIIDTNDIEVRALNDRVVTDGQAPTVIDAAVTASNTITVKFSEPITTSLDDYTGVRVDGVSRNVVDLAGSGTDTITLTVSGTAIPTGATGTISMIKSGLVDSSTDEPLSLIDGAGNTVVVSNQHVSAGQIPVIALTDPMMNNKPYGKITGPNTITIEFSIPVDASLGDFTNFMITDCEDITEPVSRSVVNIAGSGTDTITLTVAGSPMPVDAEGIIDVADTITGSQSGAEFAGEDELCLRPGQAPVVVSATVTGNDRVTVEFSEPVTIDQTNLAFSFTVDGEAISRTHTGVIPTSFSLVSFTVTVSEDTMLSPDATGTVDIGSGIVHQSTGVPLVPVSDYMVTDGQAPIVESAAVTDNNTVTVEFSEAVIASLDDFTNFAVTGGTGITSDEPRDLLNITGSGTDTIILSISGEVPVDATGKIDIADTITDLTGNALVETSSFSLEDRPVAAGQIPTIESAAITGPNTITVIFSEAVNASLGDFTNLMITANARNITTLSGSGTDTITLTVSGADLETTDTGSVDVSDGITDLAGNSLVAVIRQPIATDASPEIKSAAITGPNTITIEFSEPITAVLDNFVNFRVVLEDSTFESRNIAAISGNNTDTITLTVSGAPMPDDATGLVNLVARTTFDPISGADPPTSLIDANGKILVELGNELSLDNYQITDGQPDAATITGTVFVDSDGNGMMNGNESGIETTISLANGSTSDIMTGMDGMYTFGDLTPGDYTVTVAIPEGYETTTPSRMVTAPEGGTATVNFALTELPMPATITGTVFVDSDGNGMMNGNESGIETTISLANGSTSDIMTGMDGMYTFGDLTPGDYTVTVAIPEGYETTTPSSMVTLAEGDSATVDFALTESMTASPPTVTGTVFVDTNGNDVQDDGEQGYAGYEMYAINTVTDEITKAVTAEDGTYSFEITNDRTLIQTYFLPAGHMVADSTSSWFTYVTLENGQTEIFNIGFYPVPESELTSLNITVFMDDDRDGVMDAGESGLENFELVVYTYAIGPESVFTDENGMVTKTDIVPSDWAVTIFDLSGYVPTVYSYERDDDTTGKMYDSGNLVVDEPAPGSTHTMVIGLAPTS